MKGMDGVNSSRNQRNLEVAQKELLAGRISRREFLGYVAACGMSLATSQWLGSVANAAGDKAVNMFTWGGYQDSQLFSEFKEKTGITVNPIIFGSNEECFLKVKQGGGKYYDIFCGDAWWPREHYNAGTVEPLRADPDVFWTFKTLYPIFRNYKTISLPDNRTIGIPYHWEYSTVVYRVDRVSPEPNSLAVIFDSKYKGRVLWRNRATEMISLMASIMGFSIERPEYPGRWHLEPQELRKVKDELIKAKKAVQPLFFGTNAEAVKIYSAGEADLGYNSSFLTQEMVRVKGPKVRAARNLKSGERVFGYIDAWCLVKDAAHRDEGIELIQWLTSLRGRQIHFEKHGWPDTTQGLINWAVKAGYRESLETRGVLDPTEIATRMILLASSTDLQAWIDAWNEVMAS
jgi:spermidine/putrescine transport system substrate-binding protein